MKIKTSKSSHRYTLKSTLFTRQCPLCLFEAMSLVSVCNLPQTCFYSILCTYFVECQSYTDFLTKCLSKKFSLHTIRHPSCCPFALVSLVLALFGGPKIIFHRFRDSLLLLALVSTQNVAVQLKLEIMSHFHSVSQSPLRFNGFELRNTCFNNQLCEARELFAAY